MAMRGLSIADKIEIKLTENEKNRLSFCKKKSLFPKNEKNGPVEIAGKVWVPRMSDRSRIALINPTTDRHVPEVGKYNCQSDVVSV